MLRLGWLPHTGVPNLSVRRRWLWGLLVRQSLVFRCKLPLGYALRIPPQTPSCAPRGHRICQRGPPAARPAGRAIGDPRGRKREPLLAFASADPQFMTNLGGRSSSTEQFITPPAKNRSRNSVPTINVVPSCRGGAAVGFDKSVDACLAQEMSARDQLTNEWERFSSADRSSCTSVATIGGGGSYTALLSCLELKRDARNLSQGKASVLIAGH